MQLNTLYNDDCRLHVDEFSNMNVCIVTDPPYNVGYHYEGYEDNLDEYDYLSILRYVIGKHPAVVIHYGESLHKLSMTLNRAPDRCVAWVYNSNTPRQHRDIAFYGIKPDFSKVDIQVVLSAMAATRKFEGGALINSLAQLGSVLLLWFLVGIYILPLFLKKNKPYINKETLLIVSSALCFLLVVISSRVGYSPAFGAFMMGSILSETMEAEDIERTIGPVKDLFGAVFFVSVGMMVSPHVLLAHWPAILALTAAILVGQMTLGSLSFFVTGSIIISEYIWRVRLA